MKKANLYHIIMILIAPFIFSCGEDYVEPPAVTTSDNFVDLRPQQSSLKDQGSRTTCIVFAGVAALEASYKRLGYGELDLSEEFINFTRKGFYLHPKWNEILERGEDALETQLGSTGGGGGVGVAAELSKGFKIPLESVMPYQSGANYYEDNFQTLRDALAKPVENRKQRDHSNFNLDPNILTDTQLRAEKFYGVSQYTELNNAKDTDEIEAILKRGNEVIWDFAGAVPWETGGVNSEGVWQACSTCTVMGHSMLIVGFDKRDPDPNKHYFIVKNSWGRAWTTSGGEGYTYISYGYVRNAGVAASYIVLPEPPVKWEELPFIGRWKFNFDGWKGELDIYHIPGMAQYTFEYNYGVGVIPQVYNDYRIGTYYDDKGNAYKVNGSIDGNRIEFYFDIETPLQKWDEKVGRKFVYYLDGNNFMAGVHTDPDGRTYAGYATKGNYISGGAQTPRPLFETSYANSEWALYTENTSGTLKFGQAISQQSDSFIISGTYTTDDGSVTSNAQIKVYANDPSRISVQVANIGNGEVESFIGKHLSWEAGLITGNTPELGDTYPFYMRRK